MFEMVMRLIVLALSLEAVVVVAVFVGWLGAQVQKTIKEAEAAEAQRKAWEATAALHDTLKDSAEAMKKKNDEVMREIMASMPLVMAEDGFSPPSISH